MTSITRESVDAQENGDSEKSRSSPDALSVKTYGELRAYTGAPTSAENAEAIRKNRNVFAEFNAQRRQEWTLANDLEYFAGAAWSSHVYRRAMRSRVNPWGVRAVVVDHCLLHTPCLYTYCLSDGLGGGLNQITALIAASGYGKGKTRSVGSAIYVWPETPFSPRETDIKPKSGPAMVVPYMSEISLEDKSFGVRGPGRPPKAKTEFVQTYYANGFYFPEIKDLGSIMRTDRGKTLGYLLSGWSSEQLGGIAQDDLASRVLPAGGYRKVVEIGVQPSNICLLLNEVGSGLPQRAFCAPSEFSEGIYRDYSDWIAQEFVHFMGYPDTPVPMPDLPQLRDLSNLSRAAHYTKMMQDLQDGKHYNIEVSDRLASYLAHYDAEKQVHRLPVDPIDSHRMALQLRQAFAEARLNDFGGSNRVVVSDEDFQRADYVMTVHKTTLGVAQAMSEQEDSESEYRKGARTAYFDEGRESVREQKKRAGALRGIFKVAFEEGLNTIVPVHRLCRRLSTQQRALAYTALSELVDDGLLSPIKVDAESLSQCTYTLTEEGYLKGVSQGLGGIA